MSAGIFGALLVLLLAGVTLVLTTTAGARWSLAALARFAPGELAVGGVDGSFAGGLVLTDLGYESPELAAQIGRVEIEADLGALMDRRLVVERLAAENGTVALIEAASDAPRPAGEPPALPEIPEWLVVESLAVRDVALADPFDAVIARLGASVAGSRITVAALDARAADARIEASGYAHLGARATARVEGSWTTPLDAGAADAATRVEISADAEIATATMPWRATLAWDRLTVRAAGTQWSSPMGRLTLTPGTTPVEAEIEAELTGSALPTAATIAGSARLAGNTLELDGLDVETLGGRAVVRGVADVGALAGFAAVEYSMLDPSLVEPRIDGDLSGTTVTAFAAAPELVVGAAGALRGMLGGRSLDGTLRATVRNGVTRIERAHVALEEGRIDLAGRVSGDTVDLSFDAVLPELANWYPPAAGSLRAHGSLAGRATNPTIDAELEAAGLVVATLPPLDELTLDVSGTLAAHDARLAVSSPYGELGVTVEQGWNGERLAGTVRESRLAVDQAGTWTLADPAPYAVAAVDAQLEPLCYRGPEEARLCAAVADDTLRLDAADVPSTLATPWLGGGLRVSGAADLALMLGWSPSLHGTFTLTQPALRLQQASIATPEEPAPGDLASIDDLRVTGTLNDQSFEAQLTAALAASGDPLEARVTLTPPTAEGTLEAVLDARLTNLELVDALVEDVEELTGTITASLRATGTPDAPNVSGELAARSLRAVVPPLGIELTEGRLTAEPVGLAGLALTAELCSIGCIELDGSLALDDETAPWRATAVLTGDAFELADLPDLRAVIVPDLVLDATPEAWRVTGDVAITEGLLAAVAVPRSAVRPVPETVVHGRAPEEESESLPVPLVADVDVSLGDVRFEGLGVAAELDGTLDIERMAEGRLLVNGTASIEQGTFTAYSQVLMIERGDLLFTGPPENPALDVRAVREVEGATVGLTLTGTLRDPQSEVFSMPPLPESEALARLVTGRSLDSAGASDAEAIERAALGLGIRRALPALERIGGNLGLDELGVDSGSGADGALVAGRQLGEDVYLRYKHGVFDDFAGLELIYRITERFRLRTETGTSQSIDLLYQRNRQEHVPLAKTESGFEDAEPTGLSESGGLTESQ